MHRHLQRHLQRECQQHLLPQQAFHSGHLGQRRLQHQFVVDLQHDPCGQPLGGHLPCHTQHGQLDHVGCRALHDGVDRGALREREIENPRSTAAAGPVAHPVNGPPSAEHGGDLPIAAAAVEQPIHKLCGAREGAKIGGDEAGRLSLGNAQRLGQTKRALPVENSEIHRLGSAAHWRSDRRDRHAKHRRSRAGVDILPCGKRLPHRCIAGKMGENAQLDLGIIGCHKAPADLPRQEGGPDLLPLLGADRDVLQVWIA